MEKNHTYTFGENIKQVVSTKIMKKKVAEQKQIIKMDSGKFLDVGCGRGDILKAFNKLKFECEGVDLSGEAKKLCDPIKVTQANLENNEILFLFKADIFKYNLGSWLNLYLSILKISINE